ncbi:MAG TPA: putative lipopolysaccharide heptosyltransferase III, partial [Nitrospiria bacterium]|nr:putative lipopolysaccharide heptosyltransferase III [Nitrospiria bacterium]
AHIAALVLPGTEAMLAGHPCLNEVLTTPVSKGTSALRRLADEWRFLRTIRSQRFDLTIDLTSGDRAAALAWMSGAKIRVAFDTRAGMWGKRWLWTHRVQGPASDRHTVLQNLELVEAVGIPAADRRVDLYWTPDDDAAVDRWWREWGLRPGEPVVQVHPTSRWLFKCWTDQGMAAVIDALGDRGVRVVVTSGPAPYEIEKAEHVLARCARRPLALLGRTTLKQLAALTARCRLFVGIDSAPMHMAAAVATPVAAIMLAASAVHWRPWGDGHVVIEASTPAGVASSDRKQRIIAAMNAVTVAEVMAVIDAKLSDLMMRSR